MPGRAIGAQHVAVTRFRDELNGRWAMDAVDFMFATFRNNRFTASSGIPSHVAMDITRKLRGTGLLVQVAPELGAGPPSMPSSR